MEMGWSVTIRFFAAKKQKAFFCLFINLIGYTVGYICVCVLERFPCQSLFICLRGQNEFVEHRYVGTVVVIYRTEGNLLPAKLNF